MNQGIYLSVIIPAYNEEDRIARMLDVVWAYLKRQSYSSEIIAVSGNSTDNTVSVIKNKMDRISNLSVIDQKDNKGKGDAVREGMLNARGEIRLFTDADNSTDISHFDKMRPLFDQGYEVVICSRDSRDAFGAQQATSQTWYKRFLGQAGNLFIQLVVVRGIWDTQCGFKAFREFAAEKIFSQQKIPGWGFDIEVLALARALGYKIGMVPAYWINDPKSHVRFSTYFQVLYETIKIRLNFLSGKYEV
ncbi:glycosyltransferase family 2 protein [Patescibacteria group bacterium]|nr:glycosyltransferase family 2 protein [Patescibacteria group bacterium]